MPFLKAKMRFFVRFWASKSATNKNFRIFAKKCLLTLYDLCAKLIIVERAVKPASQKMIIL